MKEQTTWIISESRGLKLPCLYSHYVLDKSLFIHNPVPELSTAENLLHILRADGKYTELEARILDLALVLHAEHGGVESEQSSHRISCILQEFGEIFGLDTKFAQFDRMYMPVPLFPAIQFHAPTLVQYDESAVSFLPAHAPK